MGVASSKHLVQENASHPIRLRRPLLRRTLELNDLPTEVRLKVYRAVVGDRLIHIDEKRRDLPVREIPDREDPVLEIPVLENSDWESALWESAAWEIILPEDPVSLMETKLTHYICDSRKSELDIYNEYAQPVVFKNKIDYHMRPREEPQCVHAYCDHPDEWDTFDTSRLLDLRLLAVSPETRDEAGKALYSTNTWSISHPTTFWKWVAKIPTTSHHLIRHLRLDMEIREIEGEFWASGSTMAEWRDIIRILPAQFPNLRSLNVAIEFDGYVTCYRRSLGAKFTDIFRPLRLLKDLKVFTVIMDEDTPSKLRGRDGCYVISHDDYAHDNHDKVTFFRRKEIRRMWAEEVREVVLKKDD